MNEYAIYYNIGKKMGIGRTEMNLLKTILWPGPGILTPFESQTTIGGAIL
mgnify:CR=1 FL=1